MGLQDIVRWLVPREDHFYGFLEGQAKAAHEGALALQRFTDGSSAASVRDAVQAVEHEGDRLTHEMEEALARTFVTPIDREDLQKLSSELDDILDLTNGAIRAAVLYGVEKPTEPMKKLMAILLECTRVLAETTPNLRRNAYTQITEGTRALRKLEKEGDTIYRESVSALFHDEAIGAKELLREKEVLEDLENAIDQCETVGETLGHLAVKHG
jgi:predicted phosphate transport protein (TIGR00153 family)